MEFQEPDILIIHVADTVTVEEVDEAIRITKEDVAPEVGPPFYFVHIISGLKSFDFANMKRYYTAKLPWKAIIVIGGTRLARAAVNVSARTVALLSGNEFHFQMVEDFEAAYACANELRARQ
jgi:hypothetical protein